MFLIDFLYKIDSETSANIYNPVSTYCEICADKLKFLNFFF